MAHGSEHGSTSFTEVGMDMHSLIDVDTPCSHFAPQPQTSEKPDSTGLGLNNCLKTDPVCAGGHVKVYKIVGNNNKSLRYLATQYSLYNLATDRHLKINCVVTLCTWVKGSLMLTTVSMFSLFQPALPSFPHYCHLPSPLTQQRALGSGLRSVR